MGTEVPSCLEEPLSLLVLYLPERNNSCCVLAETLLLQCKWGERGYSAVVLSTSMVQYSAQQVYQSMGFRRVSERSPSLLASFLQFSVFYYRYAIPGSR
ncbi:major facilitator superfamily domain-containing protein 2A [Platysternon megacephalum]|uniref:Major facilitator superfamily domain-containing protein 2A n=1 Tax=Platysternon megacephalum TaxID=55544 RepID=A0A4D9DJG0_9SAUR|nr:major facilitator superfamily domain-containing protein 2A [Platysternon megacephalum]